MPSIRNYLYAALLAAGAAFVGQLARAEEAPATPPTEQPQDSPDDLSVEEIRSLLDSIDPYLPQGEVSSEVDIFGSTTMDSLAHGWALGFKKFHPEAQVIISAEGSETVFDRLLKNPGSIGMLSRPVTKEDLAKLKAEGLKRPVAIHVARDALGVFVHKDNPVEEVSYQQLVELFCAEDPANSVNWSTLGIEGDLASQPVQIIGRTKASGTRTFIEKFLFHSHRLRNEEKYLESNCDVIQAVAENPNAIAIVDFNCVREAVKRLHLREQSEVIEDTDRDVLMGRYPITRPMVLVLDADQTGEKAAANREFVRYALAQAGQTQAILSGFYPFAPPTLRAELEKLNKLEKTPPQDSSNTASAGHDLR
ncbi:substrate-binding domain-containing protein [Aeoliella sp. ICT_H6.2]|uniref:Substrate-binding domain-containing protein n=1 Tax=Aeoliella straminimaris TaxID=2954799 RepID=A0A9X2F6S5_9BACT|nr:substrate-binding domain-containing protein [Aeoliella straminimaris]MCO6042849.1 substrate-binding domain-containing protein [Aeoliella straminimaris]